MRDRGECLVKLMEECGEAIQAASKVLLMGPDNLHPASLDGTTNREWLEQELGDVLAMIQVLKADTDLGLTEKGLQAAAVRKLKKLKIWLPHKS